jgi:hypothetical protein
MTNNKQQTAMEWLEMEVKKFNTVITKEYILLLCQQAKEMEKERIETAYNKGTVHGIDYPESTLPINGEQYYNETYGGNK